MCSYEYHIHNHTAGGAGVSICNGLKTATTLDLKALGCYGFMIVTAKELYNAVFKLYNVLET